MIIAGAGGHAIEILHIFDQLDQLENLDFFDNTLQKNKVLFDRFKVLRSKEDLEKNHRGDRCFVLGTGSPGLRQKLSALLREWDFSVTSVISPTASIGNFEVALGQGINVMNFVTIYNRVFVGEGTLLNTGCSIHHDVRIGEYAEICPGARILGGVTIGSYSFIGSGAIILPGVTVGNHCVIGAGAVVTKDVSDYKKVKGVPAV
jgi:sugar O-acyltransferase (sialic acid O-acetyltransferase NeuD family)